MASLHVAGCPRVAGDEDEFDADDFDDEFQIKNRYNDSVSDRQYEINHTVISFNYETQNSFMRKLGSALVLCLIEYKESQPINCCCWFKAAKYTFKFQNLLLSFQVLLKQACNIMCIGVILNYYLVDWI